jgi:hypothetical protein
VGRAWIIGWLAVGIVSVLAGCSQEDGTSGPDFSLELSPTDAELVEGGLPVTFTCTLRPLNGYAGTVSSSVTAPAGAIVSQVPTPASLDLVAGGGSRQATFELSGAPGLTPGDGTATVSASDGARTHVGTILLHLR